MKENIQQLLGLDKSNPLFEVYFDPNTPKELLVHFGFKLLEIVPANSLQEKLLLARLINAGYNQAKLHDAFKYDIKTMKKWGLLLKSGSIEDIQKISDGQGAQKKITEEKLNMIVYLFKKHHKEEGCHIVSFITNEYKNIYNESISSETIRTKIKSLKCALNITENDIEALKYPLVIYAEELKMQAYIKKLFMHAIVSKIPKTTENTLRKMEFPTSTSEKKCKHSPELPIYVKDNFPLVTPTFKEIFSCHHIGLLLARIFIDFISSDMNDIKDIVRQWICMILSGCQNIEQGRKLNYRVLNLLVGKQKSSPHRQREKLKEIANKLNIRTLFQKNIKLVKASYDDIFLLDPHGVGYTGQLKILFCWLGGIHQTGKGYYLDLIHTLKGAPVFSKIDDNYFDLRQRFHSTIKEFRRILEGDKNRNLTIVVDRAIYDVGFMREARTENIFIITWEKNYKRGEWDDKSFISENHFVIQKYRNRKEDSYLYDVKYIKRRWSKEDTFAQYIILLEKPNKQPIELSIICTDYSRDSQKTISPILTRWLQENDMSYLILLGINSITSYGYFTYEEIAIKIIDREVKNNKLLKLMSKKNKLKNKLGRKILDREDYLEKKECELALLNSKLKSYENKLKNNNLPEADKLKLIKLKKKIKRLPGDKKKALKNNEEKQRLLRGEIADIEKDIQPLSPNVSRLEALINEEYMKLNFMPKSFMDAIKIISRNIIYELMHLFRPIWNNYRNDHVILRELLSCVGSINETDKAIYLQLNPTRQFANKEKEKILLFLFKISTIVNQKYELKKIIIITLYEL